LNGTPSGGVFVGPNVGQNSFGGYVFFASQANTGANDISYKYTTSENCEVVVTKKIYVNPEPKAGFTLSDVCDGKTIVFTDTSKVAGGSIKAWQWNFGDGNSIDTAQHIQNPAHIYGFDGTFTVSLTVYTNDYPSCSSTKTIQVIIGKTPSPAFTWENSCFGNTTRFYDITGIDGSIKERLWDFGDGTTSNASSPEHTFPAPGVFSVKLQIRTNSNCIETKAISVPIYPFVNTFPYKETFETSSGGWVSGGTNSSWQLGELSGTLINQSYSGSKAWATNANNGSYNNNEKSFLEGPCFNLSMLSKPMVSFKLWLDTDQGADGAVLQITLDNGKTWEVVGELNKGIGWYNSSPIIGGPGGQQIMGWSGRDKTIKWREAKYYLDKYKYASSVRFRISFGSSSENPANSDFNGIAIDDFWIGERSHTVLVEHFMNGQEGMEEAHVISRMAEEEQTELVDILYHTAFPDVDSTNLKNEVDPSARALFYSVENV
jgi:PKD repeat protein